MSEGYDTAQVCPNGHVANQLAATRPQHNQPFCGRCGEATITACPKCQAAIRGYYHSRIAFVSKFKPPGFCFSCGTPFPWTERKLQAALYLFFEETQNQEEREEFSKSVEQVSKDTPQAQVASKKINRLLGKIGKETASAIRDIVVDIASEAAKKMLLPGK